MHAATFTAVVVFPTPPFWFAIAYTVPIAFHGTGGDGRRLCRNCRELRHLTLDLTHGEAVCGPFPHGGGTAAACLAPSGRGTGGEGRTRRRARPRARPS